MPRQWGGVLSPQPKNHQNPGGKNRDADLILQALRRLDLGEGGKKKLKPCFLMQILIIRRKKVSPKGVQKSPQNIFIWKKEKEDFAVFEVTLIGKVFGWPHVTVFNMPTPTVSIIFCTGSHRNFFA